MKKWFFVFALLSISTLVFQSCEKEQNLNDEALIEAIADVELTAITPSELPAEARQTVEEMFFDTYMEDIYRAKNLGYKVVLGNENCLYFNTDGEMLEFRDDPTGRGPRGRGFGPHGPHGPCFNRLLGFGRPVRPANLPESITSYITENYPDATIRVARTNPERTVVLISGPVVLVFDANGNFVEVLDPLERCQGRCDRLTADELPEAAGAYIAANYADATFRGACARGERIVVFLTGEDTRTILVFDAAGNFLFSRP